jgi:hypothetical protein
MTAKWLHPIPANRDQTTSKKWLQDAKGTTMSNTLNVKSNAVRLEDERSRTLRTFNRLGRCSWNAWKIGAGLAGILIVSGGSALCAKSHRAPALRWTNAAMSEPPGHDEPVGWRPSAEPGSREVTAAPDLKPETTSAALLDERRPAGTRPLAGPIVSLTHEPVIEGDELLGAHTPDLSINELANKVLVQGEAAAGPAERADDFAWPRRDVVSRRSYPEVVTTVPPKTPGVAESMSATQQ